MAAAYVATTVNLGEDEEFLVLLTAAGSVFLLKRSTGTWIVPVCKGEFHAGGEGSTMLRVSAATFWMFGGMLSSGRNANSFTQLKVCKALEENAPPTVVWASLAFYNASPLGRSFHTMTVVADGVLMIFGGKGGTGPLGDVYLFSKHEARSGWLQTAVQGSDAVVPRFGHTATSLGEGRGALIFGGMSEKGPLNELLRFHGSPGNWKWEQVATTGTPPSARYLHASLSCLRCIIYHGGKAAKENVPGSLLHILSTDTMTWSQVDIALPSCHRHFLGFVADDEILLLCRARALSFVALNSDGDSLRRHVPANSTVAPLPPPSSESVRSLMEAAAASTDEIRRHNAAVTATSASLAASSTTATASGLVSLVSTSSSSSSMAWRQQQQQQRNNSNSNSNSNNKSSTNRGKKVDFVGGEENGGVYGHRSDVKNNGKSSSKNGNNI